MKMQTKFFYHLNKLISCQDPPPIHALPSQCLPQEPSQSPILGQSWQGAYSTTPPHKELVACMFKLLSGFSLMLSSYYQLCASLDSQTYLALSYFTTLIILKTKITPSRLPNQLKTQ